MKITTYNKLKKYETYLTTASKAGYIRSLTNAQIEDLITIGAELGITYKNNHCPKCALEFISKLAIPYFEMQQKIVDNKLKKEQENEKDGNKNNKSGSQENPDNGSDCKG